MSRFSRELRLEVVDTFDELYKFIYLSFYYSQGSIDLQREIFKLCLVNGLVFTAPILDQTVIFEMMNRLRMPKFHKKTIYDEKVSMESAIMVLGNSVEEFKKQGSLICEPLRIFKLMLEREKKFFLDGRENSEGKLRRPYSILREILLTSPKDSMTAILKQAFVYIIKNVDDKSLCIELAHFDIKWQNRVRESILENQILSPKLEAAIKLEKEKFSGKFI